MKQSALSLSFLASSMLLVACSPGGEAPNTSELTRDLLGGAAEGTSNGSTSDGPVGIPVDEVGINRGQVQAPVKVVELSDYGCGYCRQFHQETFPTLLAEYIETGIVEWKFVPYITGMFENSLAATEASECAFAQGLEPFEALNRRLWADQPDWKGSDAPAPLLREWASQVGLNMADYDSCMENDDRIGRIGISTNLAREVGVRGTPTFVVIGYPPLQGALPLEMFQQVLSAAHERAVAGGER